MSEIDSGEDSISVSNDEKDCVDDENSALNAQENDDEIRTGSRL